MPASPVRISLLALVLAAVVAAPAAARQYPETIPLPNGWQPEGIAAGFGNQFFSGSRATGSIFRGNLKTGKGKVLVQRTGGAATGMKVDRRNRLWVSGAATGTARVYNAGSGKLLREYPLTTDDTFINDVTLTRKAAYFTDSVNQRLYVVKRHKVKATLPLTGDLQYDGDDSTFELNGIAAAGHGRLITVQSRTGKLFVVNARNGRTHEIDLDGGVHAQRRRDPADRPHALRRAEPGQQDRRDPPQARPAPRRDQALPDRQRLRRPDDDRRRRADSCGPSTPASARRRRRPLRTRWCASVDEPPLDGPAAQLVPV